MSSRREGKKSIDQGLEEISTIVELMHKAELEASDIKEMVSEKKRRQLSGEQGRYSSGRAFGDKQGKPSNPHARFSNFFSEDPRASAMHKKLNKMHEAIHNQDHNHLHKILTSHHKKATKFQNHRRMQEVRGDENPLEHQKGRQCQILTGCVKGMSFYDVFVSLVGMI